MTPRFNIFKRKSAAEIKAEANKQAVEHFYELYGIDRSVTLVDLKRHIETQIHPSKRIIALGKLDALVRQLKQK